MRVWLLLVGFMIGLATNQGQAGQQWASSGTSLGFYGTYHDFRDLGGDAWGGGLKLEWEPAKYVAADLRASWMQLSGGDAEMIPIEVTFLGQLPLGDTVKLYAGMGGGYYMFRNTTLNVDDSPGFYPLVGLEIGLGRRARWAIFGEARWLFLEADVSDVFEEVSEIWNADLDALGVNFGIKLKF